MTVADVEFPRGGGGATRGRGGVVCQSIIWQMFCRTKMKEIGHGGGTCVPSTPPPPPPPICEVVLMLNSLDLQAILY